MTKAKLITRRELAELLEVHQMTVTKWEQAGMPVAVRGRRGKPSEYDEAEVLKWLQARDEASSNGNGIDLIRARAEKEHWQGQKARLEYEKGLGQLLPRDDVEKAWLAEITAARAVLLAIPTTYADPIHRAAVNEGVAGVERELKRASREVLTELSNPERPTGLEEATPTATKKETRPRKKKKASRKPTNRKAKKKTTQKKTRKS